MSQHYTFQQIKVCGWEGSSVKQAVIFLAFLAFSAHPAMFSTRPKRLKLINLYMKFDSGFISAIVISLQDC